MPMLYFAYGSNLDTAQMRRRCPGSRFRDRAVLPDHRLIFPLAADDWAGGVASVEPAERGQVEGVIYEVTGEDLANLDRYEGLAEAAYFRKWLRVEPESEPALTVWTYIARHDPAGPTLPSRAYREALVRGARHHGLSAEYVAWLEAIRTLEHTSR